MAYRDGLPQVEGKGKSMVARRLEHLDGIRGLAAFAVFVCHFIQVFLPHVYYLDQTGGHGLWEDEFATSPFNIIVNGNFAVCLFFVLSGYVLSHRFLASGDIEGLRRLAAKRYLRLALPVLAAVLLAWAILAMDGYSYGEIKPITRSGMTDAYATFIPFWGAVGDGAIGAFFNGSWRLDPVLWTMQTELYGSFLVFGMLALFGGMGWRWPVYAAAIAIFYNSYYLAFILGVVLADYQLQASDRDAPLLMTLLAVALGIAFGSYPYYGAEHGLWSIMPDIGSAHKPVFYHILGAALLIQAANHFSRVRQALKHPLCRFLGRISYSLYLIHFPLVCSISAGLALLFFPHMNYSMAITLAFLISVPLVIALATLFTEWVDQPAIRLADAFATRLMPRSHQREPALDQAPQQMPQAQKIAPLPLQAEPT